MSVHVVIIHDIKEEQKKIKKHVLRAEQELLDAYKSMNPKAYKTYSMDIKGWILTIDDNVRTNKGWMVHINDNIKADANNITTIDLQEACDFRLDDDRESLLFRHGDREAELMFTTDLLNPDEIIYCGMRYMR